jgi:acyl carrier protein
MLPWGEIEFLGRGDHQVKVRGYRIELGEIESQLGRHPAVREAVVVARGDALGQKVLCAYVVAPELGSFEELSTHLRTSLPEYMVPELYVRLGELPLTANGKVDRLALPAPELANLGLGTEYEAPSGEVERELAAIWEELLGVRGLGVRHDFFALGGHSLSAVQLVSRVRRRFGVEVPLNVFFAEPTVAGLAALVVERQRAAGEGAARPAAAPSALRASGARPASVPLSFAQQRLWFLQQVDPLSSAFNVPAALRLDGPLDATALARSFAEICRRHETLRTRFTELAGEVMQTVMTPPPSPLPLVDLGRLPGSPRHRELNRLAAEEVARPFSLEQQRPLWRTTLVRLAGREHALLFTIHELMCDGLSLGVLIGELAALYQAFAAGAPSPLPELPVQYADYVLWQRQWLSGELLERQLAYWRQRLAGPLPRLELPVRRRRPPVPSFRAGAVAVRVPKPLAAALDDLGRRHGATLFMTLLAAFAALLHYYTRQEDLVVGTDVANRNDEELEKLIGFFVNHLALRIDLSGDPGFRELLARARETALGGFAHQDVPIERLIAALQPQRYGSYAPLFQVMFVLQTLPGASGHHPELRVSSMDLDNLTTPFDLTLNLAESDAGLAGRLVYARDLFDDGTMSRMAAQLVTVIEQVVADPDRKVKGLALIDETESRQLVGAFNDDL